MPELPEVESYRRSLEREYKGKSISQVLFRRNDIRYPLATELKQILRSGARLIDISRDGKQLVFTTEYGSIDISLGMSGSFLPSNRERPEKHEHVTIEFSDKSTLGYIDPRRFGFWKVRTDPLSHLADPTDRSALKDLFRNPRFTEKNTSIKSALLDQHLIGGLGNIYVLEALHRAGIKPTRRVGKVTQKEFHKLEQVIPQILEQAIDRGGSTIATYRRLHGESGNFQELHLVYQRERMACKKTNCPGTIKRIIQHGRSSFYCPRCQK